VTSSEQDRRLLELAGQLTLDEKVALVQGADFWSTVPIRRIGLRAMVLSDGPSGVRGPKWDERDPSLSLPSGTAMASSWDVDVVRRYGATSAAEARRKNVDVVLGPTINLHRSPLGGRHFECLSEDPWLSAELGAAYVRGVQDHGVAATPKHYIANDSETDRFTVDIKVDDRALRELYLLPFERAVEAGAWSVMSSYNAVAGVTMSENELLESPLSSEWGFDGIVISDWTAVRSLAAASAAQDLAMPGPAAAWSGLRAAIEDGTVPESALDRKVVRILRLAARVGALQGSDPVAVQALPSTALGPAFAREAATEGIVLVRNENELPWDPAALTRVAVIGHNAAQARFQGGGSASVLPDHVISPLEGLRNALPDVHLDYQLGALVQEGIAELPLSWLQNPDNGLPGVQVTFRAADGTVLQADHRRATALSWFDGDAPLDTATTVELRFLLTADESGTIYLGFASYLRGRVEVDGQVLLDGRASDAGLQLGASFSFPPATTAPIALTGGVSTPVTVTFDLTSGKSPLPNALGLTVGTTPDPSLNADALIARAVEAARAADAVVVVVGTNSTVESEGRDRKNLNLPGRQDALVSAVAAANPRIVVVVNSGAPVLLPWRNEVSAVLLSWFGGQEMGDAIADVLTGKQEPGGRLTTTWPGELDDVPVLEVTPTDGVLEYAEGIHIGYRAWLRADVDPAYPFGHGLGYTTWRFEDLEVTAPDDIEDSTMVRVRLTNTGARAGKHVIQVYAERPDSTIERPVRWLVGFAVARAGAGTTTAVDIPVALRRFAHWDGEWRLEPGTFQLLVGSSVEDLPLASSLVTPKEAFVRTGSNR
jgi:beta-glucosidase